MYWKETKARQRLRLKAGEPAQTVAAVAPAAAGKGYCAYGYREGQTVWSHLTTEGIEAAKRRAEEWAREHGHG